MKSKSHKILRNLISEIRNIHIKYNTGIITDIQLKVDTDHEIEQTELKIVQLQVKAYEEGLKAGVNIGNIE